MNMNNKQRADGVHWLNSAVGFLLILLVFLGMFFDKGDDE